MRVTQGVTVFLSIFATFLSGFTAHFVTLLEDFFAKISYPERERAFEQLSLKH